MLRRGASITRVAVSVSRTQSAKFHASGPKLFWERLLNAPKGFGKFYPPGAAGKSGASKTAENASKTAGSKTGGGGGGGGGKKPDFPQEQWKSILLLIATAGALTALAGGDSKSGRCVAKRKETNSTHVMLFFNFS